MTLAQTLTLTLTLTCELLVAACVPSLPLDDAGCPCAAGYHCCPLEDRCLPDAQNCPLSKNCPLPPAAASLLAVGATDLTQPAPNYIPLDDVGRIVLAHGPQGGYHVNLQIQLLGLDPAGVTLTRALFDPADPSRAPESALRLQTDQPALFCDDDRAFLLLDSQRTYVCPSLRSGQPMAGRDLVLRLEAHDREGRSLSTERLIRPSCPLGDPVCTTDNTVGCAAR